MNQTYQKLLDFAETDENVLGFVLVGSRGKGLVGEHSDYDCVLIVRDDFSEHFISLMSKLPPSFEVVVFTIDEFEKHADWNSKTVWDRYNWTHLRAQIDKTGGKIQSMIDEKGKIPSAELERFIKGKADHYINQVYRSIKCFRDNNLVGHHFEAVDSIQPLFDVLFAVHNGRLRPYFKYLEWELKENSLNKFPVPADDLLNAIRKIFADGCYQSQQKLFIELEKLLRAEGYGEVFDSWGDKLTPVRHKPSKMATLFPASPPITLNFRE
ncbi:MAG: nucleotidyltransferase domain-containing protein [Pyrinomonadaceae bacterium]